MPARRKFSVYLAGPISHCNEKQKSHWRDEVKSKFGSKMTFVDPMETWRETPYEIVEADRRCIEQADGLLANMWRESIGTAMGIAHAYQRGRPIVVADPNHLESKMLSFFADAVEETPAKGAKALFGLLQAEFGGRSSRQEDGRRRDSSDARSWMPFVRPASGRSATTSPSPDWCCPASSSVCKPVIGGCANPLRLPTSARR